MNPNNYFTRGYGKEEEYIRVDKLAFENRVLVIGCEISPKEGSYFLERLLFLGSKSKDPIHLYISSFGGSVHGGLALLDALNYIKCPIYTYCLGYAMSMGSILLTSGTKGHRYAFPNSTVMIHEVSSGAIGSISDLDISVKESKRLNKLLASIIAKTSGQSINRVEKDIKRDLFLSANDALEYGLIDQIIE